MNVDWKKVSKSAGYKTIKSACILSCWGRKEGYQHFRWIIGRAIYYANTEKTTLDVVLDRWEQEILHKMFHVEHSSKPYLKGSQ